jgi:predicted P-loop ATPase
VLEGPQGILKSSACRALGGNWFIDHLPDLRNKDAQMAVRGKWIVELSELNALNHVESSHIKEFLSRQVDHFRPPYGRGMMECARQCVFIGTVNHSQYLKDETGGRRFWPVKCGKINLDDLIRDRDLLWGEAVHRYDNGKGKWWLDTDELVKVATDEQEERFQIDPWEGLTSEWLKDPREIAFDKDRGYQKGEEVDLTTANILMYAVKKQTGQWTRADEIRVGSIMHRLGYKTQRPSTGSRQRIYVP